MLVMLILLNFLNFIERSDKNSISTYTKWIICDIKAMAICIKNPSFEGFSYFNKNSSIAFFRTCE